METTLSSQSSSLTLFSLEKDLSYLYEQALLEKNLSLALKIKESQLRLFIFIKKERLTEKEKIHLQDLSDAHLKDLIDQASLLSSDKIS